MNSVRCNVKNGNYLNDTSGDSWRVNDDEPLLIKRETVHDCMGHWALDTRAVTFDSEEHVCTTNGFSGNAGLLCVHNSGDSEYVTCIDSDVHVKWSSKLWD